MRRARILAALTLGLSLVVVPSVAGACPPGPQPPQPPQEPRLTASYLYRKINPDLPASWENSGRQTLFSLRDGHAWLTSIEVGALPAEVCGDGWAVQEDMIKGLAREEVPTVVERSSGTGVLTWPPIVDARHVDLESLVDVPDCEPGPGPEPEPEPEPQPEPETEVLSGGGTAAPPATAVLGSPAFTG